MHLLYIKTVSALKNRIKIYKPGKCDIEKKYAGDFS